jgi:anthranilate synthase component 1/para-aminobenzoate synthetase
MTLIAIDGPAGAGKTTLAAKFFDEFSTTKTVALIHMDDLYDGWVNALDHGLTSRLSDIIESFKTHSRFSFPTFNWATMRFDLSQTVNPSDILIIEGVGACTGSISSPMWVWLESFNVMDIKLKNRCISGS